MRRAWTAQTILAFLLAFVGAPFLHLHLTERPGHHDHAVHDHGAVIHAHLPEADARPAETRHHSGELSHASHAAKPLNVFAVVPSEAPILALPFLVEARAELVPAFISSESVAPRFTPRTHDPPLLDATTPRAPPA